MTGKNPGAVIKAGLPKEELTEPPTADGAGWHSGHGPAWHSPPGPDCLLCPARKRPPHAKYSRLLFANIKGRDWKKKKKASKPHPTILSQSSGIVLCGRYQDIFNPVNFES